VKFDLIRLTDAADWWVLDVSLSAQQNEPPVKFDFIRLRDTADWWVLDVRICMLSKFLFIPRDAGYLVFPPIKFDLIRLRDAVDG
jgi:hypothetical protein